MTVVRSAAYAVLFYVGTLWAVVWALLLARAAPDRVGGHAANWGRFHSWCARALLGIATRVEGTVPTTPVLIAMKHEAAFETFEVLVLFDRPAVVMKRELADLPLFGRAVSAHGSIAIEREGGARAIRAMMAAGRRAIDEGRPVLIFPEGTRVPRGERPALRPGFAGLYRMLGLPVIPVAIDSGRLWPRGFLKRAGTVTVRIGEEIPPGLPRDEIEHRVHAAINALNP